MSNTLLSNIPDDKNGPWSVACFWVGRTINTREDIIALASLREMTLILSPHKDPQRCPYRVITREFGEWCGAGGLEESCTCPVSSCLPWPVDCCTDSLRKGALGVAPQQGSPCLIALQASWGHVWPVAVFESEGLAESRSTTDGCCRLNNAESVIQ